MNERIQELSVEAWRFTSNEVAYLSRIHNRSYSQDDVTDIFEVKFAELIIQECCDVLKNENILHHGYGYSQGFLHKKIKEHFGVE